MKQLIFNKSQLLEELGIVENTLRMLISNRAFPAPRKMGAKLFWLVSDVADWLRKCPIAWNAENNDERKSTEEGYEQTD